MKAACLLYIICTVVYLEWAPNTMIWFAIDIISLIMFASVCAYFLAAGKLISGNERLLLWYMFGVNISRAIYTAFCTRAYYIKHAEWVPPATHVFVTLVVATFFLFLIYLARQKE